MVAYSPLGNSHRHLAGPKVLEDRMLSKIGILYDKSSIQVALRYQVFFQHLFFIQCCMYVDIYLRSLVHLVFPKFKCS